MLQEKNNYELNNQIIVICDKLNKLDTIFNREEDYRRMRIEKIDEWKVNSKRSTDQRRYLIGYRVGWKGNKKKCIEGHSWVRWLYPRVVGRVLNHNREKLGQLHCFIEGSDRYYLSFKLIRYNNLKFYLYYKKDQI